MILRRRLKSTSGEQSSLQIDNPQFRLLLVNQQSAEGTLKMRLPNCKQTHKHAKQNKKQITSELENTLEPLKLHCFFILLIFQPFNPVKSIRVFRISDQNGKSLDPISD